MSEAQAEDELACRTHYGTTAPRAKSLGSQQDKNFLVSATAASILGVLKIANPAFTPVELDAQDAGGGADRRGGPTLRVAVPLPNLAGESYTAVTGLLDGTAYVRLLRFLPGGTLVEIGLPVPGRGRGHGRTGGPGEPRAGGLRHPGLDRALQWDLRYGADVVAELISHVVDPSRRARIEAAHGTPGRGSSRCPTSYDDRQRIWISPMPTS